MKPGLILIDIQNDYFEKGNMELVRMDHAAENAKTILAAFRKADLPLFHIQHEAIQPSATFFLPNTTGVEIHESVRPLTGETVVIKHFPNSFRETGLLDHLKEAEVTDVVINMDGFGTNGLAGWRIRVVMLPASNIGYRGLTCLNPS